MVKHFLYTFYMQILLVLQDRISIDCISCEKIPFIKLDNEFSFKVSENIYLPCNKRLEIVEIFTGFLRTYG